MFKLVKKRMVEWPVMVSEPQDGGKIKVRESAAQFELLPADEFDAIYAGGGNDVDMLMCCVTGWPEARWQDENGQPMAVTDENKAKLFNDPLVRVAFVRAVLELRAGREAARKNS